MHCESEGRLLRDTVAASGCGYKLQNSNVSLNFFLHVMAKELLRDRGQSAHDKEEVFLSESYIRAFVIFCRMSIG